MTSLGVASLRSPDSAPVWATARHISAGRLSRALTTSRIPIGLAGIGFLYRGNESLAVLLFAIFATIDYFDGAAARAQNSETASRRILDVLIDRAFIHAAISICAFQYGSVGLTLVLILLGRDVLQAAFSTSLALKYRIVVVGPKWHMSYGLSMLIWGSKVVLFGSPDPLLTVVALAVSAATLVDYIYRCKMLSSRLSRRD